MRTERFAGLGSRLLFLSLAGVLAISTVSAQQCTPQAQLTAAQRQQFAQVAHTLAGEVQSGDLAGLQNDTLPSVAANFQGIARSVDALKPLIQGAQITVNELFAFGGAPAAGAAQGVQFFCNPPGSAMTVVLNFPSIPPGQYVLAILHATGVPRPQQISFILAQDSSGQWKLAGFFARPLMLAGQDGVWYWKHARDYAQQHDKWAAWFYYQIASALVQPVNFLSSPNLEKLHNEENSVHPQDLPASQPATFSVDGQPFNITRVDTSTELGPLDFVIHYQPNPSQAAQLHDPTTARQQVVSLMSAILAAHPGLRQAFHGLWIYADSNNATLFALELPMNQIPGGAPPATSTGE